MVVRMTVGLLVTAVALAIAGRRVWWLKRLAFTGQPAPERVAAVRSHPGRDVSTEATEVIGQRKLLKWTVPGAAHAATFWGFTVLLLTIIESYGALFSRTFSLPWIGHWALVGFIEDLFAVGVLGGIITFTGARKMCRCLEYTTITRNTITTAIWASRNTTSSTLFTP